MIETIKDLDLDAIRKRAESDYLQEGWANQTINSLCDWIERYKRLNAAICANLGTATKNVVVVECHDRIALTSNDPKTEAEIAKLIVEVLVGEGLVRISPRDEHDAEATPVLNRDANMLMIPEFAPKV